MNAIGKRFIFILIMGALIGCSANQEDLVNDTDTAQNQSVLSQTQQTPELKKSEKVNTIEETKDKTETPIDPLPTQEKVKPQENSATETTQADEAAAEPMTTPMTTPMVEPKQAQAEPAEVKTEVAELAPTPMPEVVLEGARGYYLTVNGKSISMNENIQSVHKKIGEAGSKFESKSCAFEGIDKIFYYNGFILNTYPAGDEDYVLSIIITNPNISTNEGITIGMSADDIVNSYGDSGYITDSLYTYANNVSELSFILEDGVIAEISYYNIDNYY